MPDSVLSQVIISKPSRGSTGGKATALIQRKVALESYWLNPAKCRHCSTPISPGEKEKIQQAQRRRYCNWECATAARKVRLGATYVPRVGTVTKVCKHCGNDFTYEKKHRDNYRRFYCSQKCRTEVTVVKRGDKPFDELITKGELFRTTASWQSARTSVRRHAAAIIQKSGSVKECKVCQYKNHVEIAHLKSVSSFPDTATLSAINAPNNLVYLCPNHHWEYDNQLIAI